ncbi:MAG: sulfurtransferase [Opitutus sp.]|nr:sulfurtransferase [Opitutus sp.]
MPSFVNVSAYKFTPLDELPVWRERLLEVCRAGDLRGTILLSVEGINLFVAGTRSGIDALLATVRSMPGLADFTPKESFSAEQPFNRMLVKIKKEIITFGIPGIDPARRPSPKFPARTLKQWLDEGRPITLLDTRNDYEIRLGTFRGAVPAGIESFREFPAAAKKLPEEMKERPVVMFCTGGIRCEKAGPFLEQAGFKNVHQLDGGILKYFEECGGAHYEGECFVFDQRVGVDPALRETNSVLCFNCQMPLTEAEQQDPRYVPDVSCPHCADTAAAGHVPRGAT